MASDSNEMQNSSFLERKLGLRAKYQVHNVVLTKTMISDKKI